jgi:RNA polymerase sigma factor (sigma-70 family)
MTMPIDPLVAAARGGDESAFAAIVERHRRELHAHCYRMRGSVEDAEDAMQDALLRAWRGLPRFEGRSSLRSWLYTIATNASLKAIERRPWRVLPVDDERRPAQSQQATLRALGDAGVSRVVERYMRAWEHGDVDAIVALLAEDAAFAMPPTPTWFRGHQAIAAFCREAAALRWRHVATSANAQPAVGATCGTRHAATSRSRSSTSSRSTAIASPRSPPSSSRPRSRASPCRRHLPPDRSVPAAHRISWSTTPHKEDP